MPMNIGEHYQQHQILGTPCAKDNLPFLLPKLTQTQIDELDELEGPEGQSYLQSGMIVYNTSTDTVQVYDGATWNNL